MTEPPPLVVSKSDIEDVLKQQHSELMNGMDRVDWIYAAAHIDAFHALNLLTDTERDLWISHFQHCPENGDHMGGRGWCAYCGDCKSQGTLEDEDDG